MNKKLQLILKGFKSFVKKPRVPITEFYRYFKIKQPRMPLPFFVYIEPTTRCNFNCLTCSRKSLTPSRINKSISFATFKHIIEEIPTLKKIHLQGLGEPLLTTDLWKITSYASMKGIMLTTTINGSMISKNNVDKLLRAFDGIGISLDSLKEEKYNRIRVGGNFKKLMKNIQLLVERNRELNSISRLGVNMVITHENIEELEEFLKFGLKLNLNCGVTLVENWYIPTQPQYQESVKFIENSRKVNNKVFSIVSQFRSKFDQNGLILETGSTGRRKLFCVWPYTSCYISHDGYVTSCCIRQDPSVFNFGNILKTPFKKIWNSKTYMNFRNTFLKQIPNIICDKCPD